MKRLMLAASVAAFCMTGAVTGAVAQDTQKPKDPDHKQGTTGQKSSGTPQKSAPAQAAPPAAAKSAPPAAAAKVVPAPAAPAKTTQAPPPPQKTIVFQTMPTVPYQRSHGYSERRHERCQEMAWRLREYTRHAAADGYISRSERATIRDLKDDLDDKCDGFRWRG